MKCKICGAHMYFDECEYATDDMIDDMHAHLEGDHSDLPKDKQARIGRALIKYRRDAHIKARA